MKQALNFNWNFLVGQDLNINKNKDKKIVNIPHNALVVPYNYFNENCYQKIYTYSKDFDVLNYDKNKIYILNFEAFMFKAKIYLNGHELGLFYSGYLPVNIDVSKYIKEKDNNLIVVLDSSEDRSYPPFGFVIDYLTFSGIYREVNLISHQKTYLDNFYIHADKNGDIEVIFDKVGDDDIKVEHTIIYDNKELVTFTSNKYHLDNVKVWDLDNPNMYELKTVVTTRKEKETYINKFAFRNAIFKKDGFYLNDVKTKLIGLNRHQGYPYMGYAANKTLQESDAILLKESGVNVVRTSHYPQSEHFLNKCDEIGLLVVDEIPGWQHIGETKMWRDACVENTKRMVLKERNHPSIIAYGVRIDESIDDHELYLNTNKVAHELDKYRQTIGVRNTKNSELLEDIYGYNDFSCNSLKSGLISKRKVKCKNKPYLVTEYMGHMDPVKATSDIDKRIEVALRHARVINDNMKYKDIAGAIGWCFTDYHTHRDFGSGDNICPHGVFDLYRNPKLSSYIYASQQEKTPVLALLSNFKPGDVKEAIFNDLYVATNCDYFELYKNNELVKRYECKNKDYPYLKHPPVLIDDIVGLTFKENRFNKKHWPKIAKNFSTAAMKGMGRVPLSTLLYLGVMILRYHLTYDDLLAYWNKYVGAWGGEAKTYKIKGYINNKVVKEIEVGPSSSFDLDVSTNKNELVNEDTYDTLIVNLKHVDNFKNTLSYSNRVINVKVNGPLELVGPASQSLLGGQLTLYFNSKLEIGHSTITISMDDIVKTIEVDIK